MSLNLKNILKNIPKNIPKIIPAAILAAVIATPSLPARAEDPTITIGATRTLTERTLACPKESDIVPLGRIGR